MDSGLCLGSTSFVNVSGCFSSVASLSCSARAGSVSPTECVKMAMKLGEMTQKRE